MRAYIVLFLIVGSFLFSACSGIGSKKAGLSVTTDEPATVKLDEKAVGSTPFESSDITSKKYKLILSPADTTFVPLETTIRVTAGVETAVVWNFGKLEEEASGFIFEQDDARKKDVAELEVTSNPDNVPLSMNAENVGFTPILLDTFAAGQYTLRVQAPGYNEASRQITLTKGKRLIVSVKLSKKKQEERTVATPSAILTQTATPSSSARPLSTTKPVASAVDRSQLKKPYVEINETPTGFLRVRSEPSTTGKELGQLKTGEAVPYASEEQNGWFRIIYTASTSAWISSQYSTVIR